MKSVLADAEKRLEVLDVEFPDASALWLLAAVLDALEDPDALEDDPGRILDPAEVDAFEELLARRERHEPFQYIVGVADFRGALMEVDHSVFLPRSQSERMCDEIEAWAKDAKRPRGGWRVADLGTGCGAIAVSLAAGPLRPRRVWAVDISPSAAALARRNARRHGVQKVVHPIVGDWLTMVPEGPSLDLVTVVPPYLNPGDERFLSEESLTWEPRMAFIGVPSGDDILKRLLEDVGRRLSKGGLLAIQMDADQAPWVEDWVNDDPDHPLTVEWILMDEEGEPDAILAVRR